MLIPAGAQTPSDEHCRKSIDSCRLKSVVGHTAGKPSNVPTMWSPGISGDHSPKKWSPDKTSDHFKSWWSPKCFSSHISFLKSGHFLAPATTHPKVVAKKVWRPQRPSRRRTCFATPFEHKDQGGEEPCGRRNFFLPQNKKWSPKKKVDHNRCESGGA